ncbi:MAG: DNA mismatch repair endonuclease MutL [Brevinematia bacterium]
MGKIIELDYSTVVKIAAGEIVDRPASVVRELIDNSIDADSSRISVYITGGGKEYIEVIDDGTGMEKDDILISVKNHTTSKIKKFSEIETLTTLGFRGEALSSIAEVSKLTIISRTSESLVAYSLDVEAGGSLGLKETSRSKGTSVIVRDLFFNIPVRRKFLSSPASETKLVEKEIVKKALSFYKIGFEFTSEGKRKFITPPKNSYFERINDFYPDVTNDLIPLELVRENFTITGYISKPNFIRPNRLYEYFFVNNRPVEWKSFYFILGSVYEGLIPKGYFPAAFIYLFIDPSCVDVNVHPMKKEVKFKDEALIVKELRQLMEDALNVGNVYHIGEEKVNFSPYEKEISKAISDFVVYNKHEDINKNYLFERTESYKLTSKSLEKPEKLYFSSMRYIGTAFDTYLIFEEGEKIIFLDQHAAHERIMYEKLKKVYEKKILTSQELLVPVKFDVPLIVLDSFIENLSFLKAFGFEIEHFGDNTFIARSAPVFVDYADIVNVIMGFVESLKKDVSDYIDDSIKQMACKSSVKAGKRLSKDEVGALINELEKTDNNITCPHGRPIIFVMEKRELEKQFKRSGF